MKEKFETKRTENIVCPYCGYINRDSWEVDFGPGLDGSTETSCNECGRDFFVVRNVIVSYSSKK
jgi:DNA-directed RNA polymerase subunit RPC12/RpoP